MTFARQSELAYREQALSQLFRSLFIHYSSKNSPIEVTCSWYNPKCGINLLVWGPLEWNGCHADRAHNVCPLTSQRSSRGRDAIARRIMTSSPAILCVYRTFWHVVSFNAAVTPFGCTVFTPLCHACSHNYTFNFPRNLHFDYRVPRLEGDRFNFLGP